MEDASHLEGRKLMTQFPPFQVVWGSGNIYVRTRLKVLCRLNIPRNLS